MIGKVMRGFSKSKKWRIFIAQRRGAAFKEYGKRESRTTFKTLRLYAEVEGFHREEKRRRLPIRPIRLLAPGGVIAAEWPRGSGSDRTSNRQSAIR